MIKQNYFLGAVLLCVASLTQAQSLPVETVEGVPLPGVAVGVADKEAPATSAGSQTAKAMDRALYTDTRINLTLEPGTTEVIPISRNYLNRLVTPFENPKLITVNDIQFKKEGSSVFITTASEAPVAVHILSNDPSDTRSISLALVPRAIPPRTINLKWPGQPSLSPSQMRASLAKADRWEQSSPYVETLMELFSMIARGEVPPGYSLTASTEAFPCVMPGVSLQVGQKLSGSNFSVYVMRAKNEGSSTIEIVQSAGCQANGVVAVAPWPNAYLQPGESTELYVGIVNAQFEPREQINVRPSLLQY